MKRLTEVMSKIFITIHSPFSLEEKYIFYIIGLVTRQNEALSLNMISNSEYDFLKHTNYNYYKL